MIGHLQKNKINKALRVFDVIQTVDSAEKAFDINSRAERAGKIVPVYVEINIGSEDAKAGVEPDYRLILKLAEGISKMDYLHLEGLMTMGPRFGDPEASREYFRKTRVMFERIASMDLPRVDMKTLSMGMSNSYKVAIEEGSNMVRLGTIVFGEREEKK